MVAYESLKTKEKSSWIKPKVVAVAYGSGRFFFFLGSLSLTQSSKTFFQPGI